MASSEASRQHQLVFVDGSFAELAQEMADYLHVGEEVKPLLEQGEHDDVLKKIIIASSALHSMPEKEFNPSYNLLVYLVLQSDHAQMFLPRVCDNLTKPILSSPINGPGLALNALTTIFNMLEPDNELRFNVFMAILRFVKLNGMYENVKQFLPQLKNWVKEWDIDEEDQRKLYMEVAEVARDAGREEESFEHVLIALTTYDEDEVKAGEAQSLALRALKAALLSPTHKLFQDILAVPAVQALSESHPVYFELLTIFAEKDLEDYNDFNEEHEGFIEKEHLDGDALLRKIRLLSFASLAARSPNRELSYDSIAKTLQIPLEEVEIWCIDAVRAKLVNGDLSQRRKVFNVQFTVYRVFGDKQWRTIADSLDGWRSLLTNVINLLRQGQVEAAAAKKRELEDMERRLASASIGGNSAGAGGGSGGGRRGGDRAPRRERTEDDD
ncbi:PCI-domain-containing protein [Hypoxylon crocopeplum]|nr:PCI-domain-containing protein [Hypoxylon crocopeplum]